MSFISTDGSANVDQTIGNLAFYPSLSLNEFRERYRVNDTISDTRAINALRLALIDTNRELSTWKAAKEVEGHATLAAVPADSYDDVSMLITQYLTAVFSRAKSYLIDQFRDYDTTGSGHSRADDLESTADDYLRDTREAISIILDEPRTVVELI